MRQVLLPAIFFLIHFSNFAQQSFPFVSKWQFSKLNTGSWYEAEVPGTVHTDLLNNKLIPDPFIGDNEKEVQWVENEDWVYTTTFTPAPQILLKQHVELVFDGLDTYAKVYLNNQLIIEADNMFRQWRANVKSLLKAQSNELKIVFASAVKHDDSLAKLNPIKLAGENNRMYSRKAQYQYGWDWGPRLVTCGIWKPVRWEAWDKEIKKKESINYSLDVKLITQKDSIGQSFYFTVNGKPVFIKGANWIPCESFLPRAKKMELYQKLISAAKEANINMLRVWGGGIYEDDIFYDLCDKYGIMVWQDFMFAGAMYPATPTFLKNVEEEIRYQVNRLKKHPSIVLWCGNNEIDEAWHNWGWQKQFIYLAADSAKLWNDYQAIFHQLIPRVLNELDPGRPYWPSSPSIGWGRDQAYKQGDVHYWGVWWGKEPVEKYKEKVGRFNSEYGMQSFPDISTVEKFNPGKEPDTTSSEMRNHQKHPFGYSNIRMYIENRFKTPKTFEDLVYVSQLMQADAIATAIEAHRKNIPVTMGTLFWQWNDCWPVVSWSAVDYYGRKKALAYQLKRLFASLFIAAEKNERGLNVSIISDSLKAFKADIVIDYYDISGQKMGLPLVLNNQLIRPGVNNIFFIPDSYSKKLNNNLICRIGAWTGKKQLASLCYLPGSPKNFKLEKPVITIRQINNKEIELSVNKFAYGVYIETPFSINTDDNYFHLLPGEKKRIRFSGKITGAAIQSLKIRSLADTY